jgi:hypothetical protein
LGGGEDGWFGIGGIGYGTGLSKWEQNAMADPIELEMRTVDDDNRMETSWVERNGR